MDDKKGYFNINGQRLEYRLLLPDSAPADPTLVLLHEGLGCVDLWRDFPDRLAEATGLRVLLYSRGGYGRSDPVTLPRSPDYMHYEAQQILPEVLDATELERFILVGHSDGGSIALIHAGTEHLAKLRRQVQGLILLAPHVFNEAMCITSIQQAGKLYRETNLRQRLAFYHKDVDNAFWGWHDAWLTSAFKDWNIESFLVNIKAPVLLIQGEDDQYGSLAQVASIQRQVPAMVQRLILPHCGHAPHQDQSELVLNSMSNFITHCMHDDLSGDVGQ